MVRQANRKISFPKRETPSNREALAGQGKESPITNSWWMISMCGVVTVVATALAIYWQQAAAESAQALAKAEANVLLLLQQHEAVSKVYLARPNRDDATALRQLRTWVGFDEQFIAKNLTNDTVRYEVAQIAMRQSQIQLYLSNPTKAKRNLDIAQQQLEWLLETYTGSLHYTTDLGAAWTLRAAILASEGRDEEAKVACNRAIEIASSAEERAMLESNDGNRSVLNELVTMLISLGQPELAELVASQHLQQLEQLAESKSDALNIDARLETARARLKMIKGG